MSEHNFCRKEEEGDGRERVLVSRACHVSDGGFHFWKRGGDEEGRFAWGSSFKKKKYKNLKETFFTARIEAFSYYHYFKHYYYSIQFYIGIC